MAPDSFAISVVVPVYNEQSSVLPLLDEILQSLAPADLCEVIIVDDGSEDATVETLRDRLMGGERVRLLRHIGRRGQSAAIRTGVRAARSAWIATLDGDGQNDPKDIVRLTDLVRQAGADAPALVGGLRVARRDAWSKRLAGTVANNIRQALLRDDCTDTGCGLKLFRRDAFLDMPYFGALHRFLPALFRAHGFGVRFVPVNHRPRQGGQSKYSNLRRGVIGLVDLLGVFWLIQRMPAPTVVTEDAGGDDVRTVRPTSAGQ